MPAALPIREDLSAGALRALARREGKGRVAARMFVMDRQALRDALKAAAAAHPGRRLQLWFQDEARIDQKSRTAHCWWGI